MIRDHLNKVDRVFKLQSLFLKSMNNNHEFFIVDFIVTLD